MADDTAEAMANLRESCAIAAGKVPPPPPYRPEVDPFKRVDDAQVTCWNTGQWSSCLDCGRTCNVVSDGHYQWINCETCGADAVSP